MSERIAIVGKADREVRLLVEEGLTAEGYVVIGGFAPLDTGYGDRLCVPVAIADGSPAWAMLELAREQAVALHSRLGHVLYGEKQ